MSEADNNKKLAALVKVNGNNIELTESDWGIPTTFDLSIATGSGVAKQKFKLIDACDGAVSVKDETVVEIKAVKNGKGTVSTDWTQLFNWVEGK